MTIRKLAVVTAALILCACAHAAPPSGDAALAAAVHADIRASENTARDRYRHPLESLSFWGLKPGMSVLEIWPSGGYWTEILAPYAKATGGTYTAALSSEKHPLPPKFADKQIYGAIDTTIFNAKSGPLCKLGTEDFVLTARNIHDWIWTPGMAEKAMADFYAVLKPGGILAVEDHRADPRPMINNGHDGYVSTALIVSLAQKAGFVLEAQSEINANPKDTKDHPFGVWTLPPSRQSAPSGQPNNPAFDHNKYDAIGESDRMTLRFRKPG